MGRLPDYPFPKDLKSVLDNKVDGTTSEKSQMYVKVLDIWKKAKRIDVTEKHYLQLLKFALYLEEYQCEIDMRQYDLNNKSIFKIDNDIFCINTDEWLDAEKPMIREDDIIDIVDRTDNGFYSLRILQVNRTSITAVDTKFLEKYSEAKLYEVRFRYQNYPTMCNHYALGLTHRRNITKYLFPINLKQSLSFTTFKSSKFFNSSIQTNDEQAEAVLNILHKSSFPYPYILYGPPGTGKTATIVELICQIIVDKLTNRVLVCTPSNTAADEVVKRLLVYIKPEFLYRIYSRTKDPKTIDETILPCCNCKNGEITFVKREIIAKKRIVITTLCNSIKLILMGLQNHHFSHVIIDEAGQSIEPDILIPVSLVSRDGRLYSQIVLAGDPKQLGPTVFSKLAEIVLGRSILERLMSYPTYQKMPNGKYDSKYITKLLVNYRNHPDIIRIPNELFYNNELISTFQLQSNGFPVAFRGVFGKEEKCTKSTYSSRNRKEIEAVVEEIQQLLDKGQNYGLGEVSQEDIGVVTPFKLQSNDIKKALQRRNLNDINVGTVELFQGQEKKIIIISTVRSKTFLRWGSKHIGSLSNPKRFNVAVTRAKDLLIIIGNPNALKTDPFWRHLLKYCIDKNAYYGVNFKFNSLENDGCDPFETTEITVSSNLFTWKKFKLFMLDLSDSTTDVLETMRIILNSEIELTHPTRSIAAAPPTQLTLIPQMKPLRQSQPKEVGPPARLTATREIKFVHPVPPVPSIQSAPIPKTRAVHPIRPNEPPVHLTSISHIKPERPIQLIKPPAPIRPNKPPVHFSSIPDVNPERLIQIIKPATPIQLEPTPKLKPAISIKAIKPVPCTRLKPIPIINPVLPIRSVDTVLPYPLTPERKIEPNFPIKQKKKKKKCCAIQ